MIEIVNLHKKFGSKPVLQGINLTIEDGETNVIIGKSGSGKSVLLKHIVGLLFPDEGYVKVGGEIIDNSNTKKLYQIRRKFGFLFQGAALFDSMTVGENIALPIIENEYKLSQKELDNKIAKMLDLVDLPNTQNLKPAELSGGMKKRVGLARALITEPEYILYDEPTTGLDPIMSDSIDDLIKNLADKLNVTSIVVTHDMYSVKNVADEIAMVHEGKIYFEGTPEQLLNSTDKVIKDFINRTAT
ncbi:MAG: ABC transporter ATP-binding protein [Ignavibacteriae bacterium]|nr:ABC transporter ATP-binding protein [Ignavibacteriota bacterium]MCB9209548.1 ABC transporter ATP-binding protein [Ignavibacteriales bacterium]